MRLRQRQSSKGQLAPGARLNERELAQALNVSRTPLREAIKHAFARRGAWWAAELRRGGGADVRAGRDTFEVIAGLEGQSGESGGSASARPSWPRSAPALRDDGRLDARRDLPTYRLNAQIHTLINAAAQNPVLAQTTSATSTRGCRRCAFRSNRRGEVEARSP